MDVLKQYLRESHDAGRLPCEAEFEMFKADPTGPRAVHPLVHHASYRGAGGASFSAPLRSSTSSSSRSLAA
jgi:hypothetical protein